MKRKAAAIICAATVAASLLAGSTAAFAADRVIGINNWFEGAYALDILCNNAKFAVEENGDQLQIFNDEGNAEKIITDVENMISSGVDGILWMGMFENNFVVGPQIPNEAGKYFAFYDKIPSNEDLKNQIIGMEYFAGGVSNDNFAAGESMAQAALADGCTKALIASAEIGDPNSDARVKGFTDTFTAGGGEIMSTSRVATSEANGPQQACDNMLAAFPESDCFYTTGEDFTLAALSVVGKTNSDHEIKIYGTDLNPTLLEYLKDGSLRACCGANWTSALYTAIMLENALDGKKMTDENGSAVIIEDAKMISVPSEYADMYQRFFIDENPYEQEEIDKMLYVNNPDVTLDDLKTMISNYSLDERLMAKYNAGKVTKEELEALGIEVE